MLETSNHNNLVNHLKKKGEGERDISKLKSKINFFRLKRI
jgi:hypothetical protein